MQKRPSSILLCLVLILAGTAAPAPASAAPRRIEITAKRFTYEPDAITLKKDEAVLLVLKSADVTHGLQVRELGLDLKVSPDKPAEVLFTPRKVGDFVAHCTTFCGSGHGQMKITFHVVE